jgi:catechol 2,3-dioxygenase-like lactoylglutathione lyase family enzyme
MITGMHAIVYSRQAEETRAFFRDVLEWPSVDAGRGWLIFKAPPAEVAAHPSDGDGAQELYLMCDNINATVAELEAKGVRFTKDVSDQGWGLLTEFELPGGGTMGLYEPRHPVAADINAT